MRARRRDRNCKAFRHGEGLASDVRLQAGFPQPCRVAVAPQAKYRKQPHAKYQAVAGTDALGQYLTRRANQRHCFIIAQSVKRPWPRNGALFGAASLATACRCRAKSQAAADSPIGARGAGWRANGAARTHRCPRALGHAAAAFKVHARMPEGGPYRTKTAGSIRLERRTGSAATRQQAPTS